MEQAPRELSFNLGGRFESNKSSHSFKTLKSLGSNSTFPLGVFKSCQSACQSHGITEPITKAAINIPACEEDSRKKQQGRELICWPLSYIVFPDLSAAEEIKTHRF